MTPSGANSRTIISINLTLLYAFILGGVSWLCWPETLEGWRWGLLSIILGLSSFALCIKTIGDIWRHVRNDIKVHSFNRQARAPHSDRTVTDDAMRKAGMIE